MPVGFPLADKHTANLKEGGNIEGNGDHPTSGKKGGVIEGKLHSQCNDNEGCGEKFNVLGGDQIEAEKDEAVLPDSAMKSTLEYEVTGTPTQILSALSALHNGKHWELGAIVKTKGGRELFNDKLDKVDADTDVKRNLEGGSVVINRKTMADKKKYTVKGTPREIASALNSVHGNGVVIENGAELKHHNSGKVEMMALGGLASRIPYKNRTTL